MVEGGAPIVVLSGYYGFDNGGDEGLLEALLAEARSLRPDARFIVLSGNPEQTARRYGVEAIGRTDYRALRRALGEADVFVSGGGSLLQDATSPRTIPYYTGLIAWARRLDVPVVLYSQGIGPIRRPWLRRMTRRALMGAQIVSLRDRASVREAESLGVARENIELTADPVFASDAPPGDVTGKGSLLGVSLRPLQGDGSGARTDKLIEEVAAVLAPFLDKHGIRVVPLPLYPEQDTPVLRRLVERLGERRVVADLMEIPGEARSLKDWLDVFRDLDITVTMRLHGLIFSAVAETPFVALADDPKVDAHVGELGLQRKESIVSASDTSALAEVLARAWEVRSDTKARLHGAKNRLRPRARRAAALTMAAAEARLRSRERIDVLGVAFDGVTMAEAVATAKKWVESTRREENRSALPGSGSPSASWRPAHIVTANPEIVMHARRDGAVQRMLAEADLVVPDGIGIVAAARLLGRPVPGRVPGVELTEALLQQAATSGWRVFFLGGAPGVAERAATNSRRKWPGLRIVGVQDGYFGKEEEPGILRKVAEAEPDIVFVGMGAPRQDLFIASRRREGTGPASTEGFDEDDGASWHRIAVAVGVGGSIDVLAGQVPRAPAAWQKLGLEWLYRLLRQPSRFRRALSLPKFALLVLLRALRRNLL